MDKQALGEIMTHEQVRASNTMMSKGSEMKRITAADLTISKDNASFTNVDFAYSQINLVEKNMQITENPAAYRRDRI